MTKEKTRILSCLVILAFVITAHCFTQAVEVPERTLDTSRATKQRMTVRYVPFQSAYTHEMDKLIEEECMMLGVDTVTAIAIARLETGNYTSILCEESHNYGGMSDGSRYYTYGSPREGVKAFVGMIKRYADKGMTTPQKMQANYCPDNAQWAEKVETLKKELVKQKNNLQLAIDSK